MTNRNAHIHTRTYKESIVRGGERERERERERETERERQRERERERETELFVLFHQMLLFAIILFTILAEFRMTLFSLFNSMMTSFLFAFSRKNWKRSIKYFKI